eukprot:TRINITY_DN8412_c1_g1_i1.p1 TRINITY_DN8412_c1_g1~~TRINITY_DN8412_c1_g1_i1.p1  ORF type:complete len:311 (-),score=37.66 TRINITY_DN8412_c1_g1_i1:282-1163(-)
MTSMAPDYENLCAIQKVEVFEHALDITAGDDLYKVLWLKSRNCEVWLDRRTNYTRSTGVMSMVGYLLGLGDRHPSNLMLDRYSGKLLHIDFGDCFEASMQREKFPEKVPFRLTRMMVKAMEVSGIEGTFRLTCEHVMRVLRSDKDSVMAMLEAFVHDPLINWRLVTPGDVKEQQLQVNNDSQYVATEQTTSQVAQQQQQQQLQTDGSQEIELGPGAQTDHGAAHADAAGVLNERAIAVMRRMSDKLTGRDALMEGMSTHQEPDSVSGQVKRLIHQATLHENLCQSYIGWCPFW